MVRFTATVLLPDEFFQLPHPVPPGQGREIGDGARSTHGRKARGDVSDVSPPDARGGGLRGSGGSRTAFTPRFVVFLVPVHGVLVDCTGNRRGSSRYPLRMVVLLLRVLGQVVGVMQRVMLGLAPGIILGLVSATVVVVLRFVLPILSLFHPSLLPSPMRGEIVATVAVVAGQFVIWDRASYG